ncbi:MAG: Ldh family oxidoreductase [Terriglobales bacterium]
MPTLHADPLKKIANQIFATAGATPDEARIVSDALVEANLAGHDSHGIMRIPEYVRWMEQDLVTVGAHIKITREADSFAVVDGGWGFGQVVGREATEVAIGKAEQAGVGTVAASQCCHIGRVGDYPMMAAAKGMVAVMFVNTHGGGKLVAPWGGKSRRLSANPISIAIPRKAGTPIVVDISTSAIAEGKVRGMLNRKVPVPPGSIMDADGNPTTDAAKFYGPPPGALFPFGGHKGFALGLVTDILAGAISGGGCSRPEANRVGNTFLVFVLNINRLRGYERFYDDVEHLIEYVKSSELAPGSKEILIPGEPEASEKERRQRNGIAVDDETWRQITEVGNKYGVNVPQ